MSHANRVGRREFLGTSVAAATAAALGMPARAEPAEKPLPWLAGAGMAEITPPLDVGILMSSGRRLWKPFDGVRLPLHARAVVLQNTDRRIAVVSLDLLGLDGKAVGGMKRFKDQVAEAAGPMAAGRMLKGDDLILASTHTHSAPASLGLTDLVHTKQFKSWVGFLARRIGAAIGGAAGSMRPCRLVAGSRSVPGLSLNRRIKTTRGVVPSRPTLPPEIVIGPEGPSDDTVQIAALVDGSGSPVAVLVCAACHPIHEMCIPQVSPDFPGQMSLELARRHAGLVALYLNGAAGNMNPPDVSRGAAHARRHGQRLAALADEALGELRPVDGDRLALSWRTVRLPARDVGGRPLAEPLEAKIGAVRLGEAALLLLPGEPFIETALAIRKSSPWGFTMVVGYAEGYIGYIPTDRAFDNGGYETRPGAWSRVARGSEPIVRREALKLLSAMRRRPGTDT